MEQVLVVDRAALEARLGGQTFTTEGIEAIRRFIVDQHVFLPRAQAEYDATVKQIIPYVLLRRGDAYFLLRRLKKLDHSMIYVLIAGSYTPIILKFMPAPRSYIFLGVIWLIALTGIAIKLLWIDAPRLIGTALYLALGWAIAFDFGVVLSMPAPAIALLAAGGLAYTVGGVIYIAKKPNLGLMIGFHELFHLFVIVGSVCHYLMVFLYVL